MRRLLLAALLSLLAGPQAAQAWPYRHVTLIAPFGPGTSVDITARILAPRLAAACPRFATSENSPPERRILAIFRRTAGLSIYRDRCDSGSILPSPRTCPCSAASFSP